MRCRHPSEREQAAIEDALDLLLRPARRVYLIDAPTVNTSVVGTTLYVERGLITVPDLGGVLAHELGHLNSLDGPLLHATRRLLFPVTLLGRLGFTHALLSMSYHPLGKVSGCRCVAFYLALIIGYPGGVETWLLGPPWTRYWRQRPSTQYRQ